MLLIGMGAWVLRYALFAMGAPDQVTWMLLLGILLHGICYDFFFVTGFIYTDKKAPLEVRGQAQSLLVFLTQGVGMLFGYRMAFSGKLPFTDISLPSTMGQYGVLPTGTGSLAEKMTEWQNYWLYPAGMAAIIFAVFALFFWDKVDQETDAETVSKAISPDEESAI